MSITLKGGLDMKNVCIGLLALVVFNASATCIKKCSETDNGKDFAHLGITKTWDECRAPNGPSSVMNVKKFADTCGELQSIEYYCVKKVYGDDVENVVVNYNVCKPKVPSQDQDHQQRQINE